MRQKRASGITLVEVIVVTAIIMLLVGLLIFAIAPRAKRTAIETRIRSDLKQIALAVAVYRADYDDRYPPGLGVLPEGTPIVYPNWPEQSEFCQGCFIGEARYRLAYTGRMRKIAQHYDVGIEYDESKHALVDAPFYLKDTGQDYRVPWPLENGEWRMMRVPLAKTLGARSDGSVYWKPHDDEWQHMMRLYGLAKLPDEEKEVTRG